MEVPISFTAVTTVRIFEGNFQMVGKGTFETPFHMSFKTLDLHPSAWALGLHFLQLCQAMLVEQEDVRKPSRSCHIIAFICAEWQIVGCQNQAIPTKVQRLAQQVVLFLGTEHPQSASQWHAMKLSAHAIHFTHDGCQYIWYPPVNEHRHGKPTRKCSRSFSLQNKARFPWAFHIYVPKLHKNTARYGMIKVPILRGLGKHPKLRGSNRHGRFETLTNSSYRATPSSTKALARHLFEDHLGKPCATKWTMMAWYTINKVGVVRYLWY